MEGQFRTVQCWAFSSQLFLSALSCFGSLSCWTTVTCDWLGFLTLCFYVCFAPGCLGSLDNYLCPVQILGSLCQMHHSSSKTKRNHLHISQKVCSFLWKLKFSFCKHRANVTCQKASVLSHQSEEYSPRRFEACQHASWQIPIWFIYFLSIVDPSLIFHGEYYDSKCDGWCR